MDLTTYAIVLYSIRLFFPHQSHPQLGVIFTLALSLHSSGVISPSSPVAYWAPTNLGGSSFSFLSFCLFLLFMGFSRQEYWSGLSFPSPVDHVLSELSTVTRLSCVALHSMAHSFMELDKAVVHVIHWLVFCDCGLHYVYPLMDKDKRLMEASWWETDCGGNWVLFWCAGPCSFQFSPVQLLSRVWLLQHTRLPYPSSTPGACSNSCPSSRWCHPTILSSVIPFSSYLQFFPASGSFPVSQFFASGGQSIGALASGSVFPVNIQDWFPLGLTGLILESKGVSRVFSNNTVLKHQFFSAQLSLWFNSHMRTWPLEKP